MKNFSHSLTLYALTCHMDSGYNLYPFREEGSIEHKYDKRGKKQEVE